MRYLLAVDPGIRGCGIALFSYGQLLAGEYIRNPAKSGAGPMECLAMGEAVRLEIRGTIGDGEALEIIAEWPQIYQAGKLKGDPNDLPPLAGVDVAIFAACNPTLGSRHYLPREWKAQMPTEGVLEARIKARLSAEEWANISAPKSLLHNVWDAVGLGLKHLGRLEPKRVIER